MADSATPPTRRNSRPPRAASTKRRAPAVSTATEDKLARAAKSAQRFAQLSDVRHDDGTADLFPDTTPRVSSQATAIDLRQGTLTGFELPPEVIEAVVAASASVPAVDVREVVVDAKATRRAARPVKAEAASAPAAAPVSASASIEAAMPDAPTTSDEAAPTGQTGVQAVPVPPLPAKIPVFLTSAATRERDTPELDHARATAFADTVNALYGVIADQRRTASDHARRTKTLLWIVVGVLSITVAIGVAEAALLMRLSRDATAQQQNLEGLILNQQFMLSTLLETRPPAAVSPPADVPAVVLPPPRHVTKPRAHKPKRPDAN